MPSGNVHMTVGGLGFLVFLYFTELWHLIYLFPVAVLYSVLPDLDANISPAAVFVRKFCLSGLLLGAVAWYVVPNFWVGVFTMGCVILLVMQVFSHHRSFFHSWVAAILLSLPLAVLGWEFVLVGFIAYIIHLGLDGELFNKGLLS